MLKQTEPAGGPVVRDPMTTQPDNNTCLLSAVGSVFIEPTVLSSMALQAIMNIDAFSPASQYCHPLDNIEPE